MLIVLFKHLFLQKNHNMKHTLLSLVLFCQILIGQQMPLDFSETADSFATFGNSGFSLQPDPLNSTNQTGQFFNNGSDPWQGFGQRKRGAKVY